MCRAMNAVTSYYAPGQLPSGARMGLPLSKGSNQGEDMTVGISYGEGLCRHQQGGLITLVLAAKGSQAVAARPVGSEPKMRLENGAPAT